MTTTPLPPLDWVSMLKDAIGVVKSKPTYKRFIDGTPLSNDVPVWMADFAIAQAEQARADLEAENKQLRTLLAEAADDIESWGAYASDYFQKKHDLAGCVAKYRAALESKP